MLIPRPDRTLSVEKRKLRQQMAARRMQLPHAAMLSASTSIARHFADHPILSFAPSFAGYIAIRGELDVMATFREMQRFYKHTALPVITPEKSLIFRAWAPGSPLIRNTLGTEEPIEAAREMLPAVILVPLLAFDGDGYRLGYGGGYYDRAMASLRELPQPPLFIGVAYAMQEIDQVPSEAHDARLDGVLTELGVSMFTY